MSLARMAPGKSVMPEKAGAETPTTLLGAKSMRQSTLTEYNPGARCPTCGDVFDSDVAVKAHHQHHDQPYYEAIICQELNLTPREFLLKYHHEEGRTGSETGEVIGASVGAIRGMAKRHGVTLRDTSEATELEWSQKTEEERHEQVKDAHERTRELVENGEHIFQDPEFERTLTEEFKEKRKDTQALDEWRENNPEKFQRVAEKAAPKGAPAREENGMAGVTGQDHPRWRGGKSIYDAVKKQLPGESWRQKKVKAKENDDNTCQMCGASECKLDSHHIIPIMAGGTNGFWNLITLCESCHTTVEQNTRDLSGMGSVLK